MKETVKDYLGNPLYSGTICAILANMLGWANIPTWDVLEKDLRFKLARLKELEGKYIDANTRANAWQEKAEELEARLPPSAR